MFLRLGGRCTHTTPYHSPEKAFRRPSFWSHSKCCPPIRQLVPVAPQHTPLRPLCFCIGWFMFPVLHSSDSLWCLIPSWLCPPSVRRAARPVMNIQRSAYLTGLSFFSKPLGTILQPQETHSMDLLLSRFVSLAFPLLSLPSVFVPLGFLLNTLIHPIEEFICCCS